MTFRIFTLSAAAALALAAGPAFAQSGTMPMQRQGMDHPGMDHPGMGQSGPAPGMNSSMCATMCGGVGGATGAGMAQMPAPRGAAAVPSTVAFAAANDKMHKDMAIEFSGDADADFARGMIPHHQGAIDMARIELLYGKDPELKTLAEEIIKAQESEIAFLKSWVAKAGK